MSLHILTFRFSGFPPLRLDQFLFQEIPEQLLRRKLPPEVSRSKIRRLILSGSVSMNGKQERNPARSVHQGTKIAVRLDTEKLSFEKQPDDIKFELTPERVLFEDEFIIVVDKPANFPTEATIVKTRDHLQAAVVRYLSRNTGTAEPYVGLHHRLDRETSGVILFSKQRSANSALHRMFLERTVHKRYQALVIRPGKKPGKEFSVENMLGRISPKSAPGKWGSVKQGGEPARTDFIILGEHDFGLHVLAIPLTGRTHQIRVHLAGLGMPILGDTLYGGPSVLDESSRSPSCKIPRVMLHAASLTFPHPVNGNEITVEAPLPEDFCRLLRGDSPNGQ
jgi:pseudouridine synthase, RluA family